MSESKYRALLASIAASESRGVDWAAEIEAALAEPPVQAEPVAWLIREHASEFNDYRTKYRAVLDKPKHGGQPLYLHPPAAQVAELAESLELAVDLVDRDVIRVRPSDKGELIEALTTWNTALTKYKEQV